MVFLMVLASPFGAGPVMPLTHLSITNAKPLAKAYKLSDSDALYLAVRASGAKLWRMNYRHLGRQKTLHLGAWPEVGIAAARAKRDAARMHCQTNVADSVGC